ncbi:MAG TPA: methylmalonyl-CoA mutase family protein, partial [Acidimicrobiales bacterium]|nr:methylmalonyl-CoA mutase family protein [Acidimicrobiales bacterium]
AKQVESGERVVVGVNRFTSDDAERIELLRIDPAIEQGQRDRLAALRARRDGAEVSRLLGELGEAARNSDNVCYPMRAALAAGATGGEVCDALRAAWGTYQPHERL